MYIVNKGSCKLFLDLAAKHFYKNAVVFDGPINTVLHLDICKDRNKNMKREQRGDFNLHTAYLRCMNRICKSIAQR